ncbi:helical backbone metal receptor [Flaviaesturariibacter terrae]
MPALVDPFGNELRFIQPPRRIVSLVPSQTELLHELGLDEEVAGITKFCIHPDRWFRNKPRVGGTKTVDAARVAALKPDLILANREENIQEQVEALARQFPTWVSDIHTLEEALDAVDAIGQLVHREAKAVEIRERIAEAFGALPSIVGNRPNVAYLIWKDPWMSVGNDTFIHDMLEHLGVHNFFAKESRYPEIEPGALAGCDYVLLSSEPYPFQEKHMSELQQLAPGARVLLVDGELFSWYGSRLLHTPAYFRELRKEMGILA